MNGKARSTSSGEDQEGSTASSQATALEEARATIRRLNRRIQSAEAGLAEKINANAGRSFGRSLANAAAAMARFREEDVRELLTKEHNSAWDLRNDILTILDAPWFKKHPEDHCARCGRSNVQSWHAPSPLWNAVLRSRKTGEDAYSIVCPPCFAELAASVIGREVVWCFKPHDVDVRPLWTDGDGREWDAESCLWREPNAESASVVFAVDPSRSTPKTNPDDA